MADNPGLNAPASGAYGEKKQIEDLKSSLPASGAKAPAAPPAPPQVHPTPVPQREGRPAGPTGPPGVPPSLLRPDQSPSAMVPAPDPAMQQAAQAEQINSLSEDERFILFFDVLSTSPGVSAETREWARLNLNMLVGSEGD